MRKNEQSYFDLVQAISNRQVKQLVIGKSRKMHISQILVKIPLHHM